MKKLFIVSLMLFLIQNMEGQISPNIVPAGDFEFFDPNAIPHPGFTLNDAVGCGNLGGFSWIGTDNTPIDPSQGDSYYNPWDVFWAGQSNGPDYPHYFSSYWDNNNPCFTINTTPLDLQIPSTDWGTINTIGGLPTNAAIMGLGRVGQLVPLNRHGIKIQLKQPLKVNHSYTLEFDAANIPSGIGNNNKAELVFGVGTNSNWSSHEWKKKKKITNNIGTSGNNWNHYQLTISFDEDKIPKNKWCSLDWLFIHSTPGNERAVIDNVKINATCTDLCSPTQGIPTISCTNFHATNLPLTFRGLKTVSSFTLSIGTIQGQNVVSYVVNNHYCHDVFSWDGKNQFGAFVADAPYTYELITENDCSKCQKTGYFVKAEQYLVNASKEQSYYTMGINANQVNASTIEFSNLNLVNKFTLFVYNSSNNLVRTFVIADPPPIIAFDGNDNLGNQLPAGTYKFGWEAENQCLNEKLSFTNYYSFTLNGAAAASPYLNPVPQTNKPYFICDVNFQTASADIGDRPCCPFRLSHTVQYPIITDETTYRVIDNITATNSRVLPGAHVDMHAGNSIVMEPGTFIADAGSQFTAEIEPCNQKMHMEQDLFDNNEYLTTYNIPTRTSDEEVEENYEIDNSDLISFFPNPATNDLFINFSDFDLNELNGMIRIYDTQGKEVKNIAPKNTIDKVDISELGSGIYLLKITGHRLNFSSKFIINR